MQYSPMKITGRSLKFELKAHLGVAQSLFEPT